MANQKESENNKTKQLSRRDFLKAGGAVIASAAVFGSLAACSMKTTTATTTATTTKTSTVTTTQIPKKYQLGAIIQLTGMFGGYDSLLYQETKIAVDLLNETGFTVGGQLYNIDLVVEDGQSSTDGNLAAMNKLVFSDGVKFVVGPGAWFGSAVSGLCEQNKIMHILTQCTMQPGEMDKTTTWAFLGGDAVIEPFFALVPYLKANYPNVKKICLIQDDSGSIPYVQPVVTSTLQAAGYTVVGNTVGYDIGATDFSTYAARVVATGADCCISLAGLATTYGAICKGTQALGSKMVWAFAGGQSVNDLSTVAGSDALANAFDAGFTNVPPNMDPLQAELSKRILAQMGDKVPQNFQYCNPIYEYMQLFQKANSFDPATVKATFEGMSNINTMRGPGTIGGLKTYGINHAVSYPLPIFTFDSNGNPVYKQYETIAVP
jgi:ABC-type branched-subunit amino acid transport system substrate-binding protein